MEQRDHLLGVVQTLLNWRKPIILICAVAVLGTILISLFLPNYYKATTVFLATSPDQAKPDALFSAREYYGNANDVDRLLTIAESNELVEYLVNTFDLYEHYGINPKGSKAAYLVREKFFSLYDVVKNKRDAIELSVEDQDRELAAKIANAAREKIDEIAQKLIKEGQEKAIQTFENQVQVKEGLLKTVSDTLIALRRVYGIYNTVAQTENLTEQKATAESKLDLNRKRLEVLRATPGVPRDTIMMLNALVQGLEEEVKGSDSRIQNLNDGMANVLIFEKQWYEANAQLTEDLEKLKLWRSAYAASIPATALVEQAEVPLVKSRPKRSILVLTAGVIAFVFSVIAILLLDNYHEYWQTTLKPAFVKSSVRNNYSEEPLKTDKKQKKKLLEPSQEDEA